MANKGFRREPVIMAAFGLFMLLGSGQVHAAEVYHLANGINATVYLSNSAPGTVELVENVDQMYPFDEIEVVGALAAMRGFKTSVDVDVFILPGIPVFEGGSFSARNAIYLAPGSGPVDPSTQAYIATHEMGHVLTWAFIDGQPRRWQAYLDIRGLDEASLEPDVAHADRAREILAEDIRALFGGSLATAAGSIENHDLIYPTMVTGLEKMLSEFFLGRDYAPYQAASSSFPNPCNPKTTIEMILPPGLELKDGMGSLKIFDIRGAHVKTCTGGLVANNRLSIQWDGTGRSGGVVSSGRYLYVLEIGQLVSNGAITLVR